MGKTLLDKYGALISTIIKKINPPPQLIKDAYQIAYITLYKNIDKVDLKRGKATTFLWHCIYNSLQTFLLKEKTHYISPQAKVKAIVTSIEEYPIDHLLSKEQPSHLYLNEFLQKIQLKFNEHDVNFIVKYYCENTDNKEMRLLFGNYSQMKKRIETELQPIFKELKEL